MFSFITGRLTLWVYLQANICWMSFQRGIGNKVAASTMQLIARQKRVFLQRINQRKHFFVNKLHTAMIFFLFFVLEFALQDKENTAPLCPAKNQTASRNLMSEQQFFFCRCAIFIKHKGWKQMGKAVCSVLMMCLWWRAKHFMMNSGQMNTKQAFPWVTKQTDAELKEN